MMPDQFLQQQYNRFKAGSKKKEDPVGGPGIVTAQGDTVRGKDYADLVDQLSAYNLLTEPTRADSARQGFPLGSLSPRPDAPPTYQEALGEELKTFKDGQFWNPYEKKGKFYVNNKDGKKVEIEQQQFNDMIQEDNLVRENRRIAGKKTGKAKKATALKEFNQLAKDMRAAGMDDKAIYINLSQWIKAEYGLTLEDLR